MIKNFFLSLFVMAGLAVSAQAQSVSQVYLATSQSPTITNSTATWHDVMSTTISTAGTYVIAVATTLGLPNNNSVTGVNIQTQLLKNGTYISLSLAQETYPTPAGESAFTVRLVSFAVVTLASNDVVKLQAQGTLLGGSGSIHDTLNIDGQDAFDGATVITLLQL